MSVPVPPRVLLVPSCLLMSGLVQVTRNAFPMSTYSSNAGVIRAKEGIVDADGDATRNSSDAAVCCPVHSLKTCATSIMALALR